MLRNEPMAQGTSVLGGAVYSYFRYQQHRAQEKALSQLSLRRL